MKKSDVSLFLVLLVLSFYILLCPKTSQAAPIYSSVTGHWYESFQGNISWLNAKTSAEALGGYLAAITSQEEQSWIESAFNSSEIDLHWLGGFQSSNSGGPGDNWQWVSGELWSYTNWNILDNPPQPDDQNGTEDGQEDYLQFHVSAIKLGVWNDYRNNGGAIFGYMVEYETPPVPGPSTLLLLGVGIVGVSVFRKKFRS